ncbi:hypothetical protein CYMTET_26098 [Cymbomonas tetramitiformis]|uniref:Uncharacterized protein n=1 Tax=Cymbomonas tetramitiformis TaxID=36881 RepID=A0AAE0KYK6_9CHLO|nr:hypothetical protein CYMTET_26098 [Cymbomonas tetramitiformis]
MGKSAVLDCGVTNHIFDSMKVFTEDDDGDHRGDLFGDNFDDSIPDLDSGSDSHEDDDPEACQAAKLGVLFSPLPTFLEMRGSLRSDCASTAAVTVTPLIAIATVEIIFVSLAFLSLHEKYIYVKTEFSAALPTLSDLEEAVCDHWENVLVTDKGATGTALGLAQDMLTRGKFQDGDPADYVENGAADSSFANSGVAANDGRQLLQAMRQGTSLQPYLSAINGFHKDLHYPGPAKGRAVTRAVKGMTALTGNRAAGHHGDREDVAAGIGSETDAGGSRDRRDAGALESLCKEKGKNNQQFKRRLWIPVIKVAGFHELLELWEEARDGASLRGAPTRTSKSAGTDSYWRLPWESGKLIKADVAKDFTRSALGHVGCGPSEGGHFTVHSTRKGAAACSRAVGVLMEKVCFCREWSQLSTAVQTYIDSTAVVDDDMIYYFGWLASGWRSAS